MPLRQAKTIMTQNEQRTARVPDSCAGRRLDAVLADLFPEYSRSRLSAWVKTGDVSVDGASARPRAAAGRARAGGAPRPYTPGRAGR